MGNKDINGNISDLAKEHNKIRRIYTGEVLRGLKTGEAISNINNV